MKVIYNNIVIIISGLFGAAVAFTTPSITKKNIDKNKNNIDYCTTQGCVSCYGYLTSRAPLLKKYSFSSSSSSSSCLHNSLFDDGDDDNNDNDKDGIGKTNNDNNNQKNNKTNQDGEDLAKQFFNEIRNRNTKMSSNQTDETSSSSSSSSFPKERTPNPGLLDSNLTGAEARRRNREPLSNPNEEFDFTPTPKIKTTGKKFTGQRRPTDYSAGTGSLFASSSSSPRGNNNNNMSSNSRTPSPREQMMERELNLVERAERGLALQAIFAAVVLCFYIYVGVSGGITSGSDALNYNPEFDDSFPIEEVMPARRDVETSVWL